MKNKILLVFTGGTICSFKNEKTDKLGADVKKANRVIVENFRNSGSRFAGVHFDEEMLLNTLSENMTVEKWNALLGFFRDFKRFNEYDGVIILHGTDTLAFTSALLSLTLGNIGIPVMLVSSQLDLSQSGANGNLNFKVAVELIMKSIKPNVYAVYKNSDGRCFVHYGAHLQQCACYSDDFFSKTQTEVIEEEPVFEGVEYKKSDILNRFDTISGGVLKITPYVGLDYNAFNLENIKAVVHGTYHSQSVCVSTQTGSAGESALQSFIKKCSEKGILVIIEPCSEAAYKYESTKEALESGAIAVYGMTSEMTYVKTLLGVSMNLSKSELSQFLKENVNNEFIA